MTTSTSGNSAEQTRSELMNYASEERAAHNLRFFKTGPGEYGYGDKFMGATMPQIRQVAKSNKKLDQTEVIKLVKDDIHEVRMLGLLIWTYQYEKADNSLQAEIYESYLAHTKYINNWDLVDVTCHKIVGAYLYDKNREVLHKMSKSSDLWEKRISMMSTYYFIKRSDFADALVIAKTLLNDEHDLIHKVVGWMLREIGKIDKAVETEFLDEHYQVMPRTMLRYAIEKYPENERQQYLQGTR